MLLSFYFILFFLNWGDEGLAKGGHFEQLWTSQTPWLNPLRGHKVLQVGAGMDQGDACPGWDNVFHTVLGIGHCSNNWTEEKGYVWTNKLNAHPILPTKCSFCPWWKIWPLCVSHKVLGIGHFILFYVFWDYKVASWPRPSPWDRMRILLLRWEFICGIHFLL